MASKVKKGFLHYLAWFLFISFGIICIFVSILLFNPGKDVFGINLCYVSQSVNKEYKTIEIAGKPQTLKSLNLENIVINTNISNVVIETDASIDQLTVAAKTKVSGLAMFDQYKKYSISITHSSNTLVINVTESSLLLAFNNNCSLKIICPKDFNLNNTNLTLNSTSGGLTMGASNQFVNTLNSLKVLTSEGTVKLLKNSSFVSGNVTIKSKSLNADIDCDVKSNLNITTNKCKLKLDNISGNLNLTANTIESKCGLIKGNVTYACDDGYINIDTIGSMTQMGSFTSNQETNISNVTINKMYGNVAIPNGKKSDIVINELYGVAVIETNSGNVKIGKCNQNAFIKTTSGDVTITQTNILSKTEINTTSGKITTNFTSVGNVKLISNTGKINVNVATDIPFKLIYETTKSISISFITSELNKSDEILIATEQDVNNVMEIKTDNKITLKDGFIIE